MEKRYAEVLMDIAQSPELVPDHIPKGVVVEIIREVEHADFHSGKGYIVYWKEKAYADVVDKSRLKFK